MVLTYWWRRKDCQMITEVSLLHPHGHHTAVTAETRQRTPGNLSCLLQSPKPVSKINHPLEISNQRQGTSRVTIWFLIHFIKG